MFHVPAQHAVAAPAGQIVTLQPLAYAQERANLTMRAYLVTAMGHVMLLDRRNEKVAQQCGGIVAIVNPAECVI